MPTESMIVDPNGKSFFFLFLFFEYFPFDGDELIRVYEKKRDPKKNGRDEGEELLDLDGVVVIPSWG